MENHDNCPVDKALKIIGKRWNAIIIKNLVGGSKRFCQLEEGMVDITPAMLSKRLKELEELNIVERNVIPERPVRIEYRLSKKGLALKDVIDGISKWAVDWLDDG